MSFVHQLKTIVRYEYITTVRSKSFWISLFALPLFFIATFALSAFSSSSSNLERDIDPTQIALKIAIIDNSGLFETVPLPDTITKFPLSEETILRERTANQEFDLLIIFPEISVQNSTIQVFGNGINSLRGANYLIIAQQLFKYAAISQISDPFIKSALNNAIPVEISPADPSETTLRTTDFVLPAVFFGIFFMVVFVGGQTLLQSMSEEKENRMLESLLSIMDTKTLILGKLISILAITITQIIVWIGSLIIVALILTQTQMGEYLSLIFASVSIWQILWYVILIIAALFSIGGIMIGVGSLGKSYRDSTQMSTVFIMISLFPLFVIGQLISDPHGTLAVVSSYIPLTSPLVLLLRSAFGLSGTEMVLSLLVNIVYAIGSIWLSIQLFKIGALETGRTIGFKELLRRLRNSKSTVEKI
jgi:ABC-2 type transport system permease protein